MRRPQKCRKQTNPAPQSGGTGNCGSTLSLGAPRLRVGPQGTVQWHVPGAGVEPQAWGGRGGGRRLVQLTSQGSILNTFRWFGDYPHDCGFSVSLAISIFPGRFHSNLGPVLGIFIMVDSPCFPHPFNLSPANPNIPASELDTLPPTARSSSDVGGTTHPHTTHRHTYDILLLQIIFEIRPTLDGRT